MCQIMEEVYAKGEARGEARGKELGAKKGKKQIIMQFLKNMSIREVADNLDMTIEEVEKIINSDD